MQQRIEEVSSVTRRVEVELAAGEVDSLLDDAVRQYGENLALDGFRAGNVPPALVEKRFAKEVMALALQNMLDQVMASLIHEHKLYPVNRVAYDGCDLARGKSAVGHFQVEVIPPLPLPEKLEDLAVQVKAPVVEQQVFWGALQRLRQTMGELRNVAETRHPQDGDVAFLDIQAALAGQPIPGLCVQNLALRLGREEPHPEICQVARTLKVEEQGVGVMPCPKNYPDQALRGKEIQLTVRLRDLKKEILPALDDALAVKLGKQDLRSLQNDIYKELLNNVIVFYQREAEDNLLGSLLDPLEFELPPSLVTIHRKAYLLHAQAYLERQGFKADELARKLEALAAEAEAAALAQAKAQAFLMALAYREKLVLSEDELKQEIEQIAQQTQRDAKQLEAELYGSNAVYELQDRLLADKALRHLYTKARKIVVDKEGKIQSTGAMPKTGTMPKSGQGTK